MKKELIEGVDYTVDPGTGNLVFTARYLRERGFCCRSGCRNCPYGFKKVLGETKKPPGRGSGKS